MLSSKIKSNIEATCTFLLHPFVVVWFWSSRWTIHNSFTLQSKVLRRSVNPLAYPFVFVYYLTDYLGKCWRLAFAEYGVRRYADFVKRHYAVDGLGKVAYATPQEFKGRYDSLHSRFSYYLDNGARVLSCKDGESFLDAACGYGENLKELVRRFPHSKIHGFDVSPNAISFIEKSGYGKNVTCSEGSMLDWEYMSSYKNTSFDWVLYSHAFSFIFDSSLATMTKTREKLLSELFRIAKKGLIMLEDSPSADIEFVLEQNTRAFLKCDPTQYFNKMGKEVYAMHNPNDCWAYVIMK